MEIIPSNILYSKALVLIDEIKLAYEEGTISSLDDMTSRVQAIFTDYKNNLRRPLTGYDPYVEGEPPISSKFNKFWNNVNNDILLLQRESDLLRASTLFTHNLVQTEIQKSKNENSKLLNKIKTLQLYTSGQDSNIIIFGDSFSSDQFIDNTFSDAQTNLSIDSGFLTLGKTSDLAQVNSPNMKILENSNGLVGNNQEVIIEQNTPTTAANNNNYSVEGAESITFRAETNRADNFVSIIDNKPNTWLEYEAYEVSNADKNAALNYNFYYQINPQVRASAFFNFVTTKTVFIASSSTTGGSVLSPQFNFEDSVTSQGYEVVDWSVGPSGNVLKLSLLLDLSDLQLINRITYSPYGMENNINYPVFVKGVETSEDGTDWVSVYPQKLWVGTSVNLQTAQTADDVTIGNAVWEFPERSARYVRIHIEQPNPYQAKIGHIYYITQSDINTRVRGPDPDFVNLTRFYQPRNLVRGNLIQQREYFNGKRWAIGIRDISIQKVRYLEKGSVSTKPIRSGGVVDRVALEADIYVPNDFDPDFNWIQFHVSPNDGVDWFPISRIQDDNLNIPEIIAFNDPLPEDLQEQGVSYINVDNTVTNVRLRISMSRPSDKTGSSPILRSYQLKVTKR